MLSASPSTLGGVVVLAALLAPFSIGPLRSEEAPPGGPDTSASEAVEAVLDDFHQAAADADEGRYFGHLSPEAVFLGTDARERWTRDQFREFVHPHFSRGQGWTYTPVQRHVSLSADGSVAWFDERLENSSYGTCRGTGSLQIRDGIWKIEQYNLTIPVPNELSKELVSRIRALEGENSR